MAHCLVTGGAGFIGAHLAGGTPTLWTQGAHPGQFFDGF